MKILINDFEGNHERLSKIFANSGYERNELIFCSNYEEVSNFLTQNMEIQKCHIDLIVTNNVNSGGYNPLKAESIAFLKNAIAGSYSLGNFRISSIPIILYSDAEPKSDLNKYPFDAIIKTKETFHHPYFISQVEHLIKEWRQKLYKDFEKIELKLNDVPYFKNLKGKNYYYNKFGRNYDSAFFKTSILSKEFIIQPRFLKYDWLNSTKISIEEAIYKYRSTYTNHIKYNRYNNERTVLHDFFRKNPRILLRDSYMDYVYERELKDLGRTGQECDFILTTNIPNYLSTTFFEVKKEDVKLMVQKRKKRPQLSSEFSGYLGQLWDYKKYSQNPKNEEELTKGIGYKTNRYSYQILAGRLEEKEEVIDVFNERLKDHYPGLEALTFEELEKLNIGNFEKFVRLEIRD